MSAPQRFQVVAPKTRFNTLHVALNCFLIIEKTEADSDHQAGSHLFLLEAIKHRPFKVILKLWYCAVFKKTLETKRVAFILQKQMRHLTYNYCCTGKYLQVGGVAFFWNEREALGQHLDCFRGILMKQNRSVIEIVDMVQQ